MDQSPISSNNRTNRGYQSTDQRPHYPAGSTKPAYDNVYWKLKFYSEDDDSMAKEKSKTAIFVDFLIDENRIAHRTDLYSLNELIVRRGQEFKLNVDVKVPFNEDSDNLQFIFSKGDRPQESKGSLIRLNIYKDKDTADKDRSGNWIGYISSINKQSSLLTSLTIIIQTPPDALVGSYTLQTKLFTVDQTCNQRKTYTRDEEGHIYVLFNAWCKDDQVYMDNDIERNEYVMNETGRIWVGKANKNVPRPWNFGQFGPHCLEAATYLLRKCKTLQVQGHGNATLVCRAISAMANKCSDADDGILVGNWSGKYDGCTSPTEWNGSQAILSEYMLQQKAVKYGQCWVFSGLLTTLGRALGIPTRPVTNFESAHDKDISMTIDSHYDSTGKPLSKMDDSVWNFHVWNESWFKRPDLPDGYDGWQAYDATPQEASEGIFRCGPAPVKAIKEGSVYLGYDSKFIFAEVNGDRMTWIVMPNSGDMYSLSDKTQTESVGKCISTKLPGSTGRNDITNMYKYPEGSVEERQSVARASKFSSRKKELSYVYPQNQSDVSFTYHGETKTSGDVYICLTAKNGSAEERIVTITITLHAAYYTGIPAEELCHETLQLCINPSETKQKDWCIEAKDYLNIIDEDAKLKLYLMANTAVTKQVYTVQDMFEIDKPELQLQVSDKQTKVGDKFEVTIRMTNPLSVKLTECILRMEGPGIEQNMKIPIHRSINPGEELIERVVLTARSKGTREIIACLHSRQLTGIIGVTEITADFRRAVYV